MKILVSACLLGCACRYDGNSKANDAVLALMGKHTLIPVCPEQMGGLPTPRPPAERQGSLVINNQGRDVTGEYTRGAGEALRLYRLYGCDAALLKARSPSCGGGVIYDGSFTGALTAGDGVCAQMLKAQGIPVADEDHIDQLGL